MGSSRPVAEAMSASTDPDKPADEADLGALKRAEGPYPSPTHRAPDALVVLDPGEGVFVTVDTQAELLFGMDHQRLTGLGLVDVSPREQPDGRPSDAAMAGYIDRAIRGETPSFAWLFRRADGLTTPHVLRLVPILHVPEQKLRSVAGRPAIGDWNGQLKVPLQL